MESHLIDFVLQVVNIFRRQITLAEVILALKVLLCVFSGKRSDQVFVESAVTLHKVLNNMFNNLVKNDSLAGDWLVTAYVHTVWLEGVLTSLVDFDRSRD